MTAEKEKFFAELVAPVLQAERYAKARKLEEDFQVMSERLGEYPGVEKVASPYTTPTAPPSVHAEPQGVEPPKLKRLRSSEMDLFTVYLEGDVQRVEDDVKARPEHYPQQLLDVIAALKAGVDVDPQLKSLLAITYLAQSKPKPKDKKPQPEDPDDTVLEEPEEPGLVFEDEDSIVII